MTKITWIVAVMDCYPQVGDNTDVVFTVHWTCAGDDGTYSTFICSTCSLPLPSDTFTPYADLTEAQVLSWIWANGVDKAATEAAIEQKVQNKTFPNIVVPVLPWLDTSESNPE
jgi:hypothetical protein